MMEKKLGTANRLQSLSEAPQQDATANIQPQRETKKINKQKLNDLFVNNF